MAVVDHPGAVIRENAGQARSPLSRWWQSAWGQRLLVEVTVIVGVYLAYKQVRFLARGQEVEAFANTARVIRWERAMGIFNELHLQELVIRSGVIELLNRYYVSVHFPLTVALVVWAYARRRDDVYPRLRFFLVSTTVVALVIHVVFPLAPPRMLPQLGFVDTLAEYGPRVYSADPRRSIANQFAAMPSLHFGWALVLAWCIAPTLRRRWVAVVLWAHPVVTLLAITATANHYWLDAAVAGALVLLAAAGWQRRRLPAGDAPPPRPARGQASTMDLTPCLATRRRRPAGGRGGRRGRCGRRGRPTTPARG